MDAQHDFWLLLNRRSTTCSECSGPIPLGTEIAYRHSDQYVVCPVCVERLGITAARAKRYDRRKPKRPRSRTRDAWRELAADLSPSEFALVEQAMAKKVD